MTNVKPAMLQTDALRGIFRKPLAELKPAELDQAVQMLTQQKADADKALAESEKDIRKKVLVALGKDDGESQRLRDELAKLRSSRDMIALALEAAREHLAAAKTREREIEIEKRMESLLQELAAREKIAFEMEEHLDAITLLFAELFNSGSRALKKLGITISSSNVAEFRREQIQRVINIHLAMRGNCGWAYEPLPATRLPLRFGQLTKNAHAQLLIDFEEKIERYLRDGAQKDLAQAGVSQPEPPRAA